MSNSDIEKVFNQAENLEKRLAKLAGADSGNHDKQPTAVDRQDSSGDLSLDQLRALVKMPFLPAHAVDYRSAMVQLFTVLTERGALSHKLEPVAERCVITCHDPSYKSMCKVAHRCIKTSGHNTQHAPEDFEGHEGWDGLPVVAQTVPDRAGESETWVELDDCPRHPMACECQPPCIVCGFNKHIQTHTLEHVYYPNDEATDCAGEGVPEPPEQVWIQWPPIKDCQNPAYNKYYLHLTCHDGIEYTRLRAHSPVKVDKTLEARARDVAVGFQHQEESVLVWAITSFALSVQQSERERCAKIVREMFADVGSQSVLAAIELDKPNPG